MHYHVQHSMLLEVFGALKSFGKLFADGILDHALTGKSDESARLGDLEGAIEQR